MNVSKIAYAQFLASGAAATGLTVTVDVDKVARSDGTRTAVTTAGAATEGRDGFYYFRVTGMDLRTYDYVVTFKTTGTADQKALCSLWSGFDSFGEVALPDAAAGANSGLPLVGSQVPNANAAANGGLPTVDANNAVKVQSGTAANQINLSGGNVTLTAAYDAAKTAAQPGDAMALVTGAITASKIAAAVWPMVQQVVYGRSASVRFVAPTGGSNANVGSAVSPLATLDFAASVSVAGDLIFATAGDHTLTGSTVVTLPDGVSLAGAAMDVTRIIGAATLGGGGGCIVKPGSNSLVRDMTIQASLTPLTFAAPLGANGGDGQAMFQNAVFLRVKTVGATDGIYVSQSSSGDVCSFTAIDCLFVNNFDATNIFGSGTCNATFINCGVIGVGLAGQVTPVNGYRFQTKGTCRVYGGFVSLSSAATGAVTGAVCNNTLGTLELHRVMIRTSSTGGGTVLDLNNALGTLAVADCAYDPAKTAGVITQAAAPAASLLPQGQTDVRSALSAQGMTSAWAADVDAQATSAATNALTAAGQTTTLLGRIPATLFAGVTSLGQWLGLLAGKQAGNATARTEMRATGAGAGTFDETTDSQEAIRDRGDAAWTTGSGGSGGVAGAGADSVTLEFFLDPPTNSVAIPDADVWVSSDAGGTTVVAGTKQTNSAGQVTFLLDAGVTYYVWMQKDCVNPIRGRAFVAVAD